MKTKCLLVVCHLLVFASLCASNAAAQTACAPPWQIGISITTGEVLSFNGNNWKALQPETQTVDGWQPPNVPALWTLVGPCTGGGGASCTAVPSAPTNLAATNIGSVSATLGWSAVTAPSNCTITGYTVFENGTSLGTTSNTNFQVNGLTAGGTFTFTVAASDSAGSSAQSAALK